MTHQPQDCFDYPDRAVQFRKLAETQDIHDPRNLNDPARLAQLRKLMRGYRASVDSPISELFRETSLAFPKAKVILNVRESGDAWW